MTGSPGDPAAVPAPVRRAEGEELTRRFFAAAEGGDLDALLAMLAPDVVLYGDGGGKAQALGGPLHGRQQVLRLLGGLFRRGKFLGASLRLAWVNGQPGAVTYDAAGRVVNVFALDIVGGQVQAIRSVINPDKLGHLGPVSDVARLVLPARVRSPAGLGAGQEGMGVYHAQFAQARAQGRVVDAAFRDREHLPCVLAGQFVERQQLAGVLFPGGRQARAAGRDVPQFHALVADEQGPGERVLRGVVEDEQPQPSGKPQPGGLAQADRVAEETGQPHTRVLKRDDARDREQAACVSLKREALELPGEQQGRQRIGRRFPA
ncbi:MAG: nuclear transport factor 2 family protein, partial [Trebonia sp.]